MFQDRLASLNEATEWLNETLSSGTEIVHKSFGAGIVQQVTDKTMIVQFERAGQKKLGTIVCFGHGLVQLAEENNQKILEKYKDILRDNDQIRNTARRAEQELIPYVEYLE